MISFLKNVLSTALGVILALVIVLAVLGASIDNAGAQAATESETYGFLNYKSGEKVVVVVVSAGDKNIASLMVETYADLAVQEFLSPGYEETDLTQYKQVDDGSLIAEQCRLFTGTLLDDKSEHMKVILCYDGNEVLLVASDATIDVDLKLVETWIEEGDVEAPKNFTDVSDKLN